MTNDRRAYDRDKIAYTADLLRSLATMLDDYAPAYLTLMLIALAACAEHEATGLAPQATE